MNHAAKLREEKRLAQEKLAESRKLSFQQKVRMLIEACVVM